MLGDKWTMLVVRVSGVKRTMELLATIFIQSVVELFWAGVRDAEKDGLYRDQLNITG